MRTDYRIRVYGINGLFAEPKADRSFDAMWKALDYAESFSPPSSTTAISIRRKLMRNGRAEFYLPKSVAKVVILMEKPKNPK